MTFSPYLLFRRGTLAADALTDLVPRRTWELLAEADALRSGRAGLARSLEIGIHAAVPQAGAQQRRELLRLRRDIHNDRAPARPECVRLLPATWRATFADWARELAAEQALLAWAQENYVAELDVARKALAEVAHQDDFRCGLQLSGEDLYREVMAYAGDPFAVRRKPSRRRRIESTITSYAYRVVFKPSPFGSFTEIGAQPWPDRPAEGYPATSTRVARARLNVGLLAWLAHQLRRVDPGLGRVRLNNSLRIVDGGATFVSRPLEGSAESFAPDRVVSATAGGLVELLLAELGDGERAERELLDRLIAAGLTADAAARTLDQLVRVGLCHRGAGLPDQAAGAAGALATHLRAAGTQSALECAEIMARFQEIEDGYAAASAPSRTALLAELRQLLERFVAVTGAPAPAPDAMRTAVYEDVGNRGRASTWDPALLERNRKHVEQLQLLLPVLDDAGIEKLGLYGFATETAGLGPGGMPLVDLYRAFSSLPPSRAAAVMSGIGDPHVGRLLDARRAVFGALGGLLARSPTATELVLDPADLQAWIDAIPEAVAPWRSMAMRVQLDRSSDRPLIVVNGVTTGHGVFFSRFCDLLTPEQGGWDLAAALRANIAATAPRQTDITAVLGLNFNLHPRLTPFELVYPGSVALPNTTGLLTLADLVVRPDPDRRRLELVSSIDGEPVDLVPLNFLYPAAGPALYRFLCAFAPTRTYRGGLWDQLDRAGPGAARRPRVLLGDLVLDRRSWRVPVGELPALDGLERQELDALADFERWRHRVGIPRTTFFRVLAPSVEASAGRDVLDETRRWALAARQGRLHKPHFLDSRNPFLMHVLAKQARDGASILFQECLPVADGHTGQPHGAEELFIEHTIGRER